jgi:addiction module RelE/StbE family toxin
VQYKTHRRFDKGYAKLPPRQQDAVDRAIGMFITNPTDPSLRVHKLTGDWRGHHSLSAGGDLRIHYIEDREQGVIVFVAVGSHSQLYA